MKNKELDLIKDIYLLLETIFIHLFQNNLIVLYFENIGNYVNIKEISLNQ